MDLLNYISVPDAVQHHFVSMHSYSKKVFYLTYLVTFRHYNIFIGMWKKIVIIKC